MKKIIYILSLTLFMTCNNNENIGGYPENFIISEDGKAFNIDEKMFYDYLKKIPFENKYISQTKYKKHLVLKIKHENQKIDFSDKILLIFENNSDDLLFNSEYQDSIDVVLGYDYKYNTNFRIYILDKNQKTIHKFISELTYPIFEENIKELDIKLFENERFIYENEILYTFRITNLVSELEQMKIK